MSSREDIDWAEVRQLLEASKGHYVAGQNKTVVLLFGLTGSGKTTSLLYLQGKKLKMSTHNTIELAETPSPHDFGTIGSLGKSETKHISGKTFNNYFLCDTAGFRDTEGYEVEIVNLLYIEALVKNCAGLIPILVFDYHTLLGNKAEHIRGFFTQFAQMFRSKIGALDEAMMVWITKVPDNLAQPQSGWGTRSGNQFTGLKLISKLLGDCVRANSKANTPEFKNLANWIILKIEEADDCVQLIRPIAGKPSPKEILSTLESRRPLEKPERLFEVKYSCNTIVVVDRSILRIISSIPELIEAGNTNTILNYILIFGQLRHSLPVVEEAFQSVLASLRKLCEDRQKDIKGRFNDMITSKVKSETVISEFNQQGQFVLRTQALTQLLPDIDTVSILQQWTYNLLNYTFTEVVKGANNDGKAMLELIQYCLAKLNNHCLAEEQKQAIAKMIEDHRAAKLISSNVRALPLQQCVGTLHDVITPDMEKDFGKMVKENSKEMPVEEVEAKIITEEWRDFNWTQLMCAIDNCIQSLPLYESQRKIAYYQQLVIDSQTKIEEVKKELEKLEGSTAVIQQQLNERKVKHKELEAQREALDHVRDTIAPVVQATESIQRKSENIRLQRAKEWNCTEVGLFLKELRLISWINPMLVNKIDGEILLCIEKSDIISIIQSPIPITDWKRFQYQLSLAEKGVFQNKEHELKCPICSKKNLSEMIEEYQLEGINGEKLLKDGFTICELMMARSSEIQTITGIDNIKARATIVKNLRAIERVHNDFINTLNI